VLPEEFRLPCSSIEQLHGGDAATNARLLLGVLEGERSPYRDVVVANAAAAFALAGKAQNFAEGAARAAEVLDSGAARAKLKALVEFTGRH
jgi:anthranilate phosphoribosyltransferase